MNLVKISSEFFLIYYQHGEVRSPYRSPVKDPFDVKPRGSNLIVEFYAYGDPLPSLDVMHAIMRTESAAFTYKSEVIVASRQEFWAENVQMVFVPTEGLRYDEWNKALWAMRMAVEDNNMYFEWSFAIAKSGSGDGTHMGYGMMHDGKKRAVQKKVK